MLTPENVKVNRITLPKEKRQPERLIPTFSKDPADHEFFEAHIFEEPLVPTSEKSVSPGENRDLAGALLTYFYAPSNLFSITSFIASHRGSRWNGALLANLGIVYRKTGHFSEALKSWEHAWQLLKTDREERAAALAGRVISELAEINAWIGRPAELERWLKESETVPLYACATEKIASARVGLGFMQKQPGDSFKCGPLALLQIKRATDLTTLIDPTLLAAQSTTKGLSLADVANLAAKAGMRYQAAKRTPGAKLLYPSVVHWKLNHYGTALREENGRVLVQDSTFDSFYGQTLWIDINTLDEEASGYFLVPQQTLPKGWTSVSPAKARTVWGKGAPGGGNTNCTKCTDTRKPPCPKCKGMPQFSFLEMVGSLSVMDTPLWYSPPRGDPIELNLTYNAREATAPTNRNYTDFGGKWNYSWLSYLKDVVGDYTSDVPVVLAGGGQEYYTGFHPYAGPSLPQRDSHAVLTRYAMDEGVADYHRTLTDGSDERFSYVTGTGVDRKVFLTEKTDPYGNKTNFYYDGLGRLYQIVDCIGQATSLYYDYGYPYQYVPNRIIDPFGRTAVFYTFSWAGIHDMTDMGGLSYSFRYDTLPINFMTSMTTPYGTSRFVSSENGTYRSIQSVDPEVQRQRLDVMYGSGLTIPADSVPGNPAGMDTTGSHLDDAGNSFFWDKKAMADGYEGDLSKARATHWIFENHNVVSGLPFYTKAPVEKRIWYNYPGQPVGSGYVGTSGLPSMIGRVLDDAITTQLTKFEYGTYGQTTKITDPALRETTFGYNDYEARFIPYDIHQKNGAGTDLLTSFVHRFNLNTQIESATDASGQTTYFGYTPQNQIYTVTNSLNQVTTYSYDPTTTYLQSITGPLGASVGFTRDGFQRIRTITDSEGYVLTYDYDNLDRVTKITHPDSTYEQFVYENLDLVSMRDRKARWTEFYYDNDRQLIAVMDPEGRVTRYEWCDCGSLAALIDPNGNTTSWGRDIQSRITSKTYPDGKIEQYTYENTTSRLLNIIDAKAQKIQYTYNVDNSVARIDYTPTTTHFVTFSYDPNYPRVTSMVDGTGTTNYSYYPVNATLGSGRLQTINGPWSNDAIGYTYDELGRAKTRTINGLSQTYGFDDLGRTTNITNSLGGFTYGYVNATSRLGSMLYPNGQTSAFAYYDNLGDQRLKTITNLSGTTQKSKFDYEYDVVGQITKWTEQYDLQTPKASAMDYDGADQLLAATRTDTSTGAILKRYVYGYDDAGNRLTEQINNAVTQGTFNNLNQLTSQSGTSGPVNVLGHLDEPATVTLNGQAASVNADNSYETSLALPQGNSTLTVNATDYSGNPSTANFTVNIAAGADRSITYDFNGNPTKIVQGTTTTTLTWDAADRCTQIKSITGSTTNLVTMSYDGLGRRTAITQKLNGVVQSNNKYLFEGLFPIQERNSTGSTVTKEFFAQGEKVGTAKHFFTFDHLGSIREVLNDSGGFESRFEYEPYGKTKTISGTFLPDWGFQGMQVLRVGTLTPLNLTWGRIYDPALGIWYGRDPIRESGGINLYTAFGGNPINSVDPLGEVNTLDRIFGLFIPGYVERLEKAEQLQAEAEQFAHEQMADTLVSPLPEKWQPVAKPYAEFAFDLALALAQQYVNSRCPSRSSGGGNGANNAANAVGLKNQLAGQEIAGGHAFDKHAAEFGFKTRADMAAHVENVMTNPSSTRDLAGGRTAYWDNATQSVVIRNPSAADGGTVFKPTTGQSYFDNLK